MIKGLLILGLLMRLVHGQAAIAILESKPHKYLAPHPLAPGELATLIVSGLHTEVPRAGIAAEAGRLPLELAGIAVTMEIPWQGFEATNLPILRIDPSGCGYGWSWVCGVLALTVHIPPDMMTRGTPARPVVDPVLTVSENGEAGLRTEFKAVPIRLTLLTACNTVPGIINTGCFPIAMHADGSFVDNRNPAHPGELITIHAIGLGRTSPNLPVGKPAPDPPPPTDFAFEVQFSTTDRSGNLLDQNQDAKKVEFSGLVPGKVGVYQFQVRIPEQINPDGYRCQGSFATDSKNLNVRIGLSPLGPGSLPSNSGSVGICVVP